MKTSVVECTTKPSDSSLFGWQFKNSFDCIKSGLGGFNLKTGSPPCNLDGVTWSHTENFVRKDTSSSATWPLLLDNNGAFIRTRVPLSSLIWDFL